MGIQAAVFALAVILLIALVDWAYPEVVDI